MGLLTMVVWSEKLEAACRKCVRMQVSDTKALARVLDGLDIAYKILSSDTADAYAKLNVSQLASLLEKENCELISMQERDESLESYYVSLVGGDKNA